MTTAKSDERAITAAVRAAESDVLDDGATSHDAVACRAYELYVARGCADGHDFDDWLQAERELRSPRAEG